MGEIESRKNLQEEASVNTPTTTAQEICSSFPSRPQLTTDPKESPQPVTDSRGEPRVTSPAVTAALKTPQARSTSTTQRTQTDTSSPPHDLQIHPHNRLGSEQHTLSQTEDTPHAVETEDHTDAVTSRGEMEDRPEGEICETQEAEETLSDPVRLSENSSNQTNLNVLRHESNTEKTEKMFADEKEEHAEPKEEISRSLNSDKKSEIERDSVESLSGTEGAHIASLLEPVIEEPKDSVESLNGTEGAHIASLLEPVPEEPKAAEAPPPTSGQVRVQRYSSARSSYPTVLSEDIFRDPRDIPLQDNTPHQPQSSTQTDEPPATPTPNPNPTHSPASHSRSSSLSQGSTQDPKQASSPSRAQTLNTADMGKQTESPKRMGLFQRLRGTPKMAIPKILIQDFSEDAEEEKLSSKERRKRRRERDRKEKEEEKLRKKREKEMEKEEGRERKKPQTRGKSFQLPSSTFRSKDSTLRRSDSQTAVTRRNSTPLAESYF